VVFRFGDINGIIDHHCLRRVWRYHKG